jgi:Rrf2 family transcriptional regulator, nitric oxide-sensitive transcriptional repressor
MLSQTVEYALRAAIFLAHRGDQPATTGEVAKHTKVPAAYLSKILQGMVKAGVVKSQRGVGGGVSLVKTPEELTILEVVNAVEPVQRIKTCPLGLRSHGIRLCPLHARIDAALAMVESAFRNTTLAEVLSETDGSIPLCDEAGHPQLLLPLTIKT